MQRRRFLKGLPVLLSGALSHAAAAKAIEQISSIGDHGRRLILIELAGANDGLNTLVPWRNDVYRAARPRLALNQSQLISVTDDIGVHASLRRLMVLMERGELAWVQGLGYPSPSRSHFTSADYWHTGGDGAHGVGRGGWLAHDIEHRYSDPSFDVHGISLVGEMGPLRSVSGRWLSASSVAQLAALSIPENSLVQGVSGQVSALDRMAARMRDVDTMLVRVSDKLVGAPTVEAFPGGAFGRQLREVTRFVAAGLNTPIFRVQLRGFDTHANQLSRQARLLGTLAESVSFLRRELKAMDEWDNTLVMTHSEFGRRLAENHSGGTDHGTAAPQFIAGGSLNASSTLFGVAPDLQALVDSDPVATLDYRALYERVLSGWLGIPDNQLNRYRDPALTALLDRG